MRFIWDENKNIENQIKHGINFEDVRNLLLGKDYDLEFDTEHSSLDEDRYIARGKVDIHGQVIVVFIEIIDDVIRNYISQKGPG